MNTSSDLVQLSPQELEQKVKDWLYGSLVNYQRIYIEKIVTGEYKLPKGLQFGAVTIATTVGLTDEERSRISSERSNRNQVLEHSA